MNFFDMQRGVALQFSKMKDFSLLRVNVPGDELWQLYLYSFPAGTNPIYRERTTHDCSCCRHCIRTMGNVVALTDKGLESIWDVGLPEHAMDSFGVVAKALTDRVKAGAICRAPLPRRSHPARVEALRARRGAIRRRREPS